MDNSEYTLSVGCADWIFIEGGMDNESQISYAVAGQYDVTAPDQTESAGYWGERAALCVSVREAGDAQILDRPEDIDWDSPEPGPLHEVTLSVAQWALVLSVLEDDAVVCERTGELEDAARERRIAARVRQQLAEKGLASLPSASR